MALAPLLSARRCLGMDLPPNRIPTQRAHTGLHRAGSARGCSALGTHTCRTPSTGWRKRGCRLPGQLPHGTPPLGQKELCGADSATPGTGKSSAAAPGRSPSEGGPRVALSLPALLPAPRCHWRCSAASLRSRAARHDAHVGDGDGRVPFHRPRLRWSDGGAPTRLRSGPSRSPPPSRAVSPGPPARSRAGCRQGSPRAQEQRVVLQEGCTAPV